MTKNNLKVVKTDNKKQQELKEKNKSLEAAISQIDPKLWKRFSNETWSATGFRC